MKGEATTSLTQGDQVAEYVDVVSGFAVEEPKSLRPIIGLLEQLGQRFGPPIENGVYADGWADIYRFFALEASLVTVAALIRYERWHALKHLLKYPYLVRSSQSETRTEDICAFDSYMVSIDEHRNARLRANRLSFTADMLKERCSHDHTSFSELVQADVFLALYGVANLGASKRDGSYRFWGPRTTVYTGETRQLPIFLKAVDSDIRAGILAAIGASSPKDLASKVEVARPELNDFRQLSLDRFNRFSFAAAVNLQALTT